MDRARIYLGLLAAALCGACGDDGGGDGGSGDTAATSAATTTIGGSTGGPLECLGIGGPGADGAACTDHGDCMSGVCLLYSDAPPNTDATCAPEPPDCNTRITGTVLNFITRQPVPGVEMTVATALSAIGDPATAMSITPSVTSDAMGRVDVTSTMRINAAIGIVSLIRGDGFILTSTGLAEPSQMQSYDVGVGAHDYWVMPTADLEAWDAELRMDPAIGADNFPLTAVGAAIGVVRDTTTGDPIPNAVVRPTDDGSLAIVRYLNDDEMTFNDMMTSTNGVFVIMQPNTPEDFVAEVDGMEIADGVGGIAPASIFAMPLNG